MAVVYVLMYFKCKICFTVYTGETKINDTYLLTYKNGCFSIVGNYLRPFNNYRQSSFNINAVDLILTICKDLRNW